MSRPGYLNYRVTETRERWLAEIAGRFGFGNSHRNRVKTIDYALMYACQRVVEREEMKMKLTDRETTIDALGDELYLKSAGYKMAIEVFPGDQKAGLDYGPVVVEIIVLDFDGVTVAYRCSSDAQDEDWEVGSIEEAVEAAFSWREAIVEAYDDEAH